jgi:hypothetical protein
MKEKLIRLLIVLGASFLIIFGPYWVGKIALLSDNVVINPNVPFIEVCPIIWITGFLIAVVGLIIIVVIIAVIWRLIEYIQTGI